MYGDDDFIIVLFLLAFIGALIFFISGFATGADYDSWTQVNDKCWLHETQDNNVWFTPGQTHPAVRVTYCEKSL